MAGKSNSMNRTRTLLTDAAWFFFYFLYFFRFIYVCMYVAALANGLLAGWVCCFLSLISCCCVQLRVENTKLSFVNYLLLQLNGN